MKTQLLDILFIIICAVVFSLITYYGYSKLLSQFSIVFALIAYFVGKYVGRGELRKKWLWTNFNGQFLCLKFTPDKKSTAHNSDGLINCLLQPGQLRNRPEKSMRENFNPLIKSCATRTVPAAETESIGLQADARVVMVFARHLDSFIVTPNARPPIGILQKRMPTLTRTATQLDRRAIMCNSLLMR